VTVAAASLVEPAYHWAPPYERTLGPVVIEFCAAVGYRPDPEQELALNDIFAEDEQQLPVLPAYAVIGPRRNIKTGVEIQTAMGWLYVLEVPDVHYSAHKWATAEGTFNTFSEIIRNSDDLSRQMLPSKRGTGYAQLRWRTGQVMTFTTRTLDGGRGTETDKHIVDEALKARSQHVGALLPALATRRLAQVLWGSSAGQATSDILRDIRDRGRRGGDRTLGYLEYCAKLAHEVLDPETGELVCDLGEKCTHRRGTAGCGMDKPRVIASANSQYGRRISPRFFVSMRAELPPAEFGREFLGWWDEPEQKAEDDPAIDLEAWAELVDDNPAAAPERMPAMSLEVSVDQEFASIAAAGKCTDGAVHVELVARLQGTGGVEQRFKELAADHGPISIAIDGKGPAARLIKRLREAGFNVVEMNLADIVKANGDFLEAIEEGAVVHGPQTEVDAAVEAARKKPGERIVLRRESDEVDVTPLHAEIWAHWLAVELDYDLDSSIY